MARARSIDTQIDLAELTKAYVHRPMTNAARARAEGAANETSGRMLDIGGGTGVHAAVWASMGRAAVVVDIAASMVDVSRRHEGISVVQGNAERLPFADDSFGLAYFHMSIHYGDWRMTLREASRVVRPGGLVDIWTFAPDAIGESSLGRWFPTVVAADEGRFPEPADLAEVLAVEGGVSTVEEIAEPIERTVREWEAAVRARFVSTLQLVPVDELEAGIAEFRTRYPDDDDIYRYETVFSRVRCSL